jgi:hypothetical protein
MKQFFDDGGDDVEVIAKLNDRKYILDLFNGLLDILK